MPYVLGSDLSRVLFCHTRLRDCPDFEFPVKAEFLGPRSGQSRAVERTWVFMSREDFTIESLARYLHLTPQQVARLADRGKIPGRKVGGGWRFSRDEIHHWLEQRIGLEEDGLPEVEGVLRNAPGAAAEQEISIADLLPREQIAIPLRARTRKSVFAAIVEVVARTGLLWDPEKMEEAIRAREEIYPTTLENGVALLHPRRPMPGILAQPLLGLGVTSSGIPFGGNRGALTDVFFLICSTDDRGHLRTLARLSRVIGVPGFLDALRQAPDPQAAHQLILVTEAGLDGAS